MNSHRRPLAEITNTLLTMATTSSDLCVTEYARDIEEYLKSIEDRNKPSPNYMTRQSEITDKMRGILIDWLVDVHLKFKLQPETLALTVEVIDRFLDLRKVPKLKLQLVGVVAMLIAAKYEEIYPPEVEHFIYFTVQTYTRDEVLKWERMMLAALDYTLTVPTPYVFLRRYIQQMPQLDRTTILAASYMGEIAMLEYKMIQYSSSVIATAVLYVAIKMFAKDLLRREPEGTPTGNALETVTGYPLGDYEPCVLDLAETLRNVHQPNCRIQAVYRKYSAPRHDQIATRIKFEAAMDRVAPPAATPAPPATTA